MSQHVANDFLFPINASCTRRNLSTTFIRSGGKRINNRLSNLQRKLKPKLSRSFSFSVSPSFKFGSVTESPSKNLVEGNATYKQAISWIRKFDGSLQNYKTFVYDCNTSFNAVEKSSYGCLLLYVMSLLDCSIFKFILNGQRIDTWEELKQNLDEHFKIRLNEEELFTELVNVTRQDNERLFDYRNRIIGKRSEFKNLVLSTDTDKSEVHFKLKYAEKFAVNSFIMAVGMNYRPYIKQQKPKTVEEAYAILRELEISNGELSSHEVENKVDSNLVAIKDLQPSCRLAREDGGVQGHNMKKDHSCQLCNRKGHRAFKCRKFVVKSVSNALAVRSF